ncbi:MAG: phage tail protein [Rhizobiales bacterium]|nr:phage tail protein [Hyphomicrobiales bacterium]
MMVPLLALGPHIFEIMPLNYQELERETVAQWASIPRFGQRSARQFVGLGDDQMTISGLIFPEALGGRENYEAIRLTQGRGVAVSLVGMGASQIARPFGKVVILSVSDTQSVIGPDGQGRVLSFYIDVAPYS